MEIVIHPEIQLIARFDGICMGSVGNLWRPRGQFCLSWPEALIQCSTWNVEAVSRPLTEKHS
jgi:hypothetical protein